MSGWPWGWRCRQLNTQPGAAKGTEPLILDLSKFQKEKFVTNGKTNAIGKTVVGRQVFDGLPFQIEGRGCVYGKKLGPEKRGDTNTYPDFIGIQVGRKFDELHLLHVTQWADVEGQEIALIRLNYADGTKHEFPILFGGHVRDWHRMPSEEKELLTDPNTKIVWRGPGVAAHQVHPAAVQDHAGQSSPREGGDHDGRGLDQAPGRLRPDRRHRGQP